MMFIHILFVDATKEYFGPLIDRHASVAMSHVAAHFDANRGNSYHVRSVFAMSRFFLANVFLSHLSLHIYVFRKSPKNFAMNEMIFRNPFLN